jgi:biotin synthase-related radical SAM superfamily protein
MQTDDRLPCDRPKRNSPSGTAYTPELAGAQRALVDGAVISDEVARELRDKIARLQHASERALQALHEAVAAAKKNQG